MNRNAKMRRQPVAAGRHLGTDPGSNKRHARHEASLLHRLIVRGGRAFFGVLPGFRHVRAANDPEAQPWLLAGSVRNLEPGRIVINREPPAG